MTDRKNARLGHVAFTIQNDEAFNEDVYKVSGEQLRACGVGDTSELNRIIHEQVGEPERFVINSDGPRNEVYTKQPDAVLGLALALNRMQGSEVPEEEKEQLRKELIRLQT